MGRHRNTSGQDFARKIQIFKKKFPPLAETKNDKGGPLPRNGESRFIRCKFGKTDREGVPVARGGAPVANLPLATGMV